MSELYNSDKEKWKGIGRNFLSESDQKLYCPDCGENLFDYDRIRFRNQCPSCGWERTIKEEVQ